MIELSAKSKAVLNGVHPDLAAVFMEAARTAPHGMDFTLLEGVRGREKMMINYGKGRTPQQCVAKGVPAMYAKPGLAKVTWLNDPFNSNHKVQADGYGHAVDAAPWPVNWNDSAGFQALAMHILDCARRLGIHVRWGRDWDEDGKYEEKGETDGPHFELVSH